MSRERLSLRLYRSLLHLYPHRFRDEYGPDMVLLIRDQLRDEPAPLVIARSAVDLAITIPTQHMEAHMRPSRRVVPFLCFVIAVAGLTLALVGGSEPTSLVLGLVLAAGAGVIGVTAWRQTSPVRASSVTADWWRFLLAGPVLVAGVVLAAGAGVEAWFLGVVIVLTAVGLTALGAVLGIAHLAGKARRRGTPWPAPS